MSPAHEVDLAFWYILGISMVLLLGITTMMVIFVVRYRRSRHPVAEDIRDNIALEIFWTVIPTLIALSMFYMGWKSYISLRTVPEGALQVEVTAQMFSWIFTYDTGRESENELVVPVGRAVKLNVTSIDVVHSLYIPAFRVKIDAVPDMTTYAWFQADDLGEYDIECAEYCGTGHSTMTAKLKIVPEPQYRQWLEAEE